MADLLTPRLASAVQHAVRLHGRDARKGSTVPVLSHLLAVCALVQQDGGDEDEAIAALLHDALEDKPELVSAAQIEEIYGPTVLDLIRLSSDTPVHYAGGPKPPWRERKVSYITHVREASPAQLRVTVADKVDNLRALLADHHRLGEAVWRRFNAGKADQVWYYQAALDAYRAAGFQGPLLDELSRLVAELQRAAAAGESGPAEAQLR